MRAPVRRPRGPRAGRVPLALSIAVSLALLAAGAVLLVWLRRKAPPAQGGAVNEQVEDQAEIRRQRDLAAAYFAEDRREKAREALRGLVEKPRPDPRDLISGAVVELAAGAPEQARALLERARELGDRSAELDYNRARVAYYDSRYSEAEGFLREALKKSPEDVPARLFLAQVLEELSAQGESRSKEVEELYRDVIARGASAGLAWSMTATYRLAQILQRSGREDEADPLFEEYDRLKERGVKIPTALQMEQGNLGSIRAPAPEGNRPAGPGALPAFEDALVVLPELAGASGMLQADLDDDCRVDLVVWGPNGLFAVRQGDGFAWSARQLAEGPIDLAVAFDLDNAKDGALDLVVARGSEVELLRSSAPDPAQTGATLDWTPWDRELPALPSPPLAIVPVDYDHEGDLDLALAGEFGARLWRNDGAGAPDAAGVFTDATDEAGLAGRGALAWCLIEDFDSDQDVDLLFGGPSGGFLADNLRGGHFADRSERLAKAGAMLAAPLAADLDGDARADLWTDDLILKGAASGPFEPGLVSIHKPQPPPAGARLRAADLDLDGSLDAYWADGSAVRGRQSVGLPMAAPFELDPHAASPLRDALFTDLDGDLAQDLALLGSDALELRRGASKGNAVRLLYRGSKDNRQAIGAVLELRAGPVYRRIFGRGVPELAGLGGAQEVDYVRVLWPNGVIQHDLRHALGDRACDRDATEAIQGEGLVGSCPFLYTWNGERFEFVSDVLGITPLGLPMEPGLLVPPDHDEYVLVRGEQLAPKDGALELQFTEELREVTYLDRIRLDVVDHPAGTEIYPNELFCFPPFPEARIHTVEAALTPARATDSRGHDWTRELAAIDGNCAAPFEPAHGQMLGLAEPHFVELEFERERVASAAKLRLLMTGWFFWTDASVNMAAARDPRFEFVPPILQVPDGAGGWKPIGPPVGFPAGKTKTMVVDLTNVLDRSDPRLRVFTTLRLSWDALRLAVDGDTVPLAQTSLEPSSAELWRRGFSTPLDDGRANQPQRFVWEKLAEFPRWNPHPGRYTRLGDCLPLLGEVDDRFVILGSGDALSVRFDARALPELSAGWRRDFLVFLDGWAKDRDPNTVDALYVEPLPFHGMSGYPYGASERFPDDEAHRRWRREWNTRDAQPWIPFQAPEGSPLGAALER
jgi:tetratricopeptide (TPR) repeat protein